VKRLSIIIPTLDEAEGIVATLESLRELRGRGHEVIVVDGGSGDGTANLARDLADRVLAASAGRASQMNAGARVAAGDVLLFLHADSRLPDAADHLVLQGLAAAGLAWGRFDVRIAGAHPLLRAVEAMMNLRSRLTHICTGDQGIFMRREAFDAVGGYAGQELMEDIAISVRLRRVRAALPAPALSDFGAPLGTPRCAAYRRADVVVALAVAALGAAPARWRAATGRAAINCRVMVFAKALVPGQVKTRLVPALGERGCRIAIPATHRAHACHH
jgi:rSAM/selenodomain-associated transferase 2